MWGVLVFNVILIMIALGILLGILCTRKQVQQLNYKLDGLEQELTSVILPTVANQLTTSRQQISSVRQLLALIPTILLQLPRTPGYLKQVRQLFQKS